MLSLGWYFDCIVRSNAIVAGDAGIGKDGTAAHQNRMDRTHGVPDVGVLLPKGASPSDSASATCTWSNQTTGLCPHFYHFYTKIAVNASRCSFTGQVPRMVG